VPTRRVDLRSLRPEQCPATITFFDRDGLEVWAGIIHGPGELEVPVFGPGRVQVTRVAYADGTFEDSAVPGTRADWRRWVWAAAAMAALVLVLGWLVYGVVHAGDEGKHKADCDIAEIMHRYEPGCG
jgi:hypothetical protein